MAAMCCYHTSAPLLNLGNILHICISVPQETADLVTFTEEVLNGKHHSFMQSKVHLKIPTSEPLFKIKLQALCRHRVFFLLNCKIFKNNIFREQLRWLVLYNLILIAISRFSKATFNTKLLEKRSNLVTLKYLFSRDKLDLSF